MEIKPFTVSTMVGISYSTFKVSTGSRDASLDSTGVEHLHVYYEHPEKAHMGISVFEVLKTILPQKSNPKMGIEFSSMSLRDSIEKGESYYIVEIKALKRILDATKLEVPVLCFVDEVLRGTNTVERIAASSRILASIAASNALMFAATHDIELTYMLEKIFENYHFSEQISEDTILFDYRLKEGRATSQNAISLLGMLGYPPELIEKARKTATHFIQTGEWEKL